MSYVWVNNKIIMNKIDLMGYSNPKKKDDDDNRMEDSRGVTPNRLQNKRPEKLAVSKTIQQSEKWRECKIIGKNIQIRSYSAACAFDNKLYVYGGYQILRGMMSDFHCISLEDNAEKFNWTSVEYKGDFPGPRSKHALIGAKNKIFLVGGLLTDGSSSNQIFAFNPINCQWTLMMPEGDRLPQIDSFGCIYLEKDGEEHIVIVCGYDGERAQYLNSIYEYNITTNRISTLFEGSHLADFPLPRSGCAAATDGTEKVYMFGGKNEQIRMNDLWEFSLVDFQFKKLPKQGDIPAQRNGHTMQYFEGKLYVFGGIHDITWELDDLQIYHLDKNRWITLEQDSPRKAEKKKKVEQPEQQKVEREKKSPKKKNWLETVNTMYVNKQSTENSPLRRNLTAQIDEVPATTGKMIDEQRKKAFLQKKQEMLKNFEVSLKEKASYVNHEAESQAIKNSLDAIGNPNPKNKVPEGKLTDFGKQSQSKFLQPLHNSSNLKIGKKPCARDGHCSIVLNQELIIFSGDRHQMSFNDIYKLNFNIAGKDADKL